MTTSTEQGPAVRLVCPTCGDSITMYVTVKGAWCSRGRDGIRHEAVAMVVKKR